jgi:hypothetical protein
MNETKTNQVENPTLKLFITACISRFKLELIKKAITVASKESNIVEIGIIMIAIPANLKALFHVKAKKIVVGGIKICKTKRILKIEFGHLYFIEMKINT